MVWFIVIRPFVISLLRCFFHFTETRLLKILKHVFHVIQQLAEYRESLSSERRFSTVLVGDRAFHSVN